MELVQMCITLSEQCKTLSQNGHNDELNAYLAGFSERAHQAAQDLTKKGGTLPLERPSTINELRTLNYRLRDASYPVRTAEAKVFDASLKRHELGTTPGRLGPSTSTSNTLAVFPLTPNPDYVCRPEIESWIRSRYFNPGTTTIYISGLPGVGKTQLALDFASRILMDQPDTNVFWVVSETRHTLENSYRSIAEALDLPDRHNPGVHIGHLVRNYLERVDIPQWLMILDGVDGDTNFLHTVRMLLPLVLPATGRGKTLITMRKTLDMSFSGPVERRVHSAMPGANLLVGCTLHVPHDDVDAANLANALDNVPLAITVASAYMTARQLSVASYIEELAAYAVDHVDGTPISVTKSSLITIRHIRHVAPSAAQLLFLMSQFNCHCIPSKMLHSYIDQRQTGDGDFVPCEREPRRGFEQDITILKTYSLIHPAVEVAESNALIPGTSMPESVSFSMHFAVHDLVRRHILSSEDPERWRRLFTRLAAQHFCFTDPESSASCRVLLPHISPLLAPDTAGEAGSRAVLILAELWANASRYEEFVGHKFDANQLRSSAFHARCSVLETCSLGGGTDENIVLGDDCPWQGAVKLEKELLKARRHRFGDTDPQTVASMVELVALHQDRDNLELAATQAMTVLHALDARRGQNHADTLSRLASLASSLRNASLLTEAERLLLEILSTGTTLASTHRAQGEWHSYVAVERENLKTRANILGPEHPETLESMSVHAVDLKNIGRFSDFDELQIILSEAWTHQLGVSVPKELTTDLTSGFHAPEQLHHTQKMLEGVLKHCELQSSHDQATLRIRDLLADLYHCQVMFCEAENMRRETLKRRRSESHRDTLVCMSDLAATLCARGCWGEAGALYNNVWCRLKAAAPKDPFTRLTGKNLFGVYIQLGQRAEAERVASELDGEDGKQVRAVLRDVDSRVRLTGSDLPRSTE